MVESPYPDVKPFWAIALFVVFLWYSGHMVLIWPSFLCKARTLSKRLTLPFVFFVFFLIVSHE